MELVCHACPKYSIGVVPLKISQAAQYGKVEEVKAWLDNGGDVNGGNDKGVPLLTVACHATQTAVVKELLKYPDLHLNPFLRNVFTPIANAAMRDCVDIVQLLLDASLKCRVDANNTMASVSGHQSPIFLASNHKHWKVVEVLLKYLDNINEKDAFQVIIQSLRDNEWSIVLALVQRDYSFADQNMREVLEKAYICKRWEVLSEVFRKVVLYDNDESMIPVNLMLKNRDWKTLDFILKFIKDTVSIDNNLAEAVLAKRNQDVEMCLEKEKYDTDTLSGTLLLASIGGTSEEVGEILVNQSNYSSQVLKFSLILAALFNRLEILVPLFLQKEKFSYQTLSRARNVADKLGHRDCMVLLNASFFMKTNEILQLDQVDFKNDFMNDVRNDLVKDVLGQK